jgi:hypothetical protein
MKKRLSFLVGLCLYSVIQSGPVYNSPDIVWKKYIEDIDSSLDSIKINRIIDISGKLLCAGSIQRKGQAITDAYFALLDSAGNLVRDTSFGGDKNEYVNALCKLTDNTIIAGAARWFYDSTSYTKKNAGLVIMKLDINLHLIKDTVYAPKIGNIPNCIARYGESGFVVGLNNAVFIADSALSIIHDTTSNTIYDIAEDTGKTIICSGMAYVSNPYGGAGSNGIWMCRLSDELKIITSKSIKHFDSDYPDWTFDTQNMSFILNDKTMVCIGGNDVKNRMGESETGVVRYTMAGQQLYYKLYESGKFDIADYGKAMDDTTFIICCRSQNGYACNPLIRKIHYDGRLLWEKLILDNGYTARYITKLNGGGYVVLTDLSILKLSEDPWSSDVKTRVFSRKTGSLLKFANTGRSLITIIPKEYDINFMDIQGRNLHYKSEMQSDGATLVRCTARTVVLYKLTRKKIQVETGCLYPW